MLVADFLDRSRAFATGFVVAGLTAFSSSALAAPIFQGLGDLPGGAFFSEVFLFGDAISDDGSVVVGRSKSSGGFEAFIWTSGGGMVGLGGGTTRAHSVSGDGSVVVGTIGGAEAFRWTSGTGVVGLGDLSGGIFDSQAHATTFDGSIIVGVGNSDHGSTFGFEAFRWTSGTGMVGLGDLPGGNQSEAFGISGDGSVIVGIGAAIPGMAEAFRWTSGGGMVGLGDLPGGGFQSLAFHLSADGSVIVGEGNSDFGQEAFLWTESGGMMGLGDLSGGSFFSQAFGVSGNGSIVVGMSATDLGLEAFIWDSVNGMRLLQDVLVADSGLDLTGWLLTSARGISIDGLTISGNGINPDGNTEAWVASLAVTVPEPSTLTIFAFGLVGLAFMTRRRRREAVA